MKREFSKVVSYKVNIQILWFVKYFKIVVIKYIGGKKDFIYDLVRDEKFLGGS